MLEPECIGCLFVKLKKPPGDLENEARIQYKVNLWRFCLEHTLKEQEICI